MKLSLSLFFLLLVVIGGKPPAKNPMPVLPKEPGALAYFEIKPKTDRLLSLCTAMYETLDLSEYDSAMAELKAIPKESTAYQPAQNLIEKLRVKSSEIKTERAVLGEKPKQASYNTEVLLVKQYLRENIKDYNSIEFVEWSMVAKLYTGDQPYWWARLKMRTKNESGEMVLKDTTYYIRNNKVIMTEGLGLSNSRFGK